MQIRLRYDVLFVNFDDLIISFSFVMLIVFSSSSFFEKFTMNMYLICVLLLYSVKFVSFILLLLRIDLYERIISYQNLFSVFFSSFRFVIIIITITYYHSLLLILLLVFIGRCVLQFLLSLSFSFFNLMDKSQRKYVIK